MQRHWAGTDPDGPLTPRQTPPPLGTQTPPLSPAPLLSKQAVFPTPLSFNNLRALTAGDAWKSDVWRLTGIRTKAGFQSDR